MPKERRMSQESGFTQLQNLGKQQGQSRSHPQEVRGKSKQRAPSSRSAIEVGSRARRVPEVKSDNIILA
jgi:hypothetical protein